MFLDNLSAKQVENLVREAYRNAKKIKTQGERVLLRGNNLEMWTLSHKVCKLKSQGLDL